MYIRKLLFLFICFGIFNTSIHGKSFSNFFFSTRKTTINSLSSFDKINRNDISLVQETGISIDIAPLFLFSSFSRFNLTKDSFRNASVIWKMRPLSFFNFTSGLHYRYFHTYSVAHGDIFFIADFIFPPGRAVNFVFSPGLNMRRIKLDTRKKQLGEDQKYRHAMFFLWQLALKIKPSDKYFIFISSSNFHAGEPVSLGYFQMELINKFRVSDNVSVLLSGGTGFSGVMSVAGTVNRIFITTGASFDIPF